MPRLSGSDVGKELCEAMGIDCASVSKLVITCDAGGFATIEVTRNVHGHHLENIKEVVEKYTFNKEDE